MVHVFRDSFPGRKLNVKQQEMFALAVTEHRADGAVDRKISEKFCRAETELQTRDSDSAVHPTTASFVEPVVPQR